MVPAWPGPAFEVGQAQGLFHLAVVVLDAPAELRGAHEDGQWGGLGQVGVFNAYLVGAVRNEVTEWHRGRETGTSKTQWQASVGAYLERRLATGRYPTTQRLLDGGAEADAAETFESEVAIIILGVTRTE